MTIHNCKYEDIIADIKKDIYGNGGKEGLKLEVGTMKTDMKWIKRIGIGIIVLLIGNITTMITLFATIYKG